MSSHSNHNKSKHNGQPSQQHTPEDGGTSHHSQGWNKTHPRSSQQCCHHHICNRKVVNLHSRSSNSQMLKGSANHLICRASKHIKNHMVQCSPHLIDQRRSDTPHLFRPDCRTPTNLEEPNPPCFPASSSRSQLKPAENPDPNILYKGTKEKQMIYSLSLKSTQNTHVLNPDTHGNQLILHSNPTKHH
ncbi:hypothetical protein Dimus_026337 [Dionaea muscipula]